MRLISLTTDFGNQDGYDGVMKAVIYSIAPDVKIIDISHQISPQNILQGGLTAVRHIRFFPEGSIHIIVVDPGVGTARRPIAARIGTQYFVAPDNGLLTPIIEMGREQGWTTEFVCLDKPAYWLDEISSTFHARDIFSPVGAHLAAGVPLHSVGSPIDDPVLLPLPRPEVRSEGIIGEVIYTDHFGNLATNVRARDLLQLSQTGAMRVVVAGQTIDGLVKTFGEAQPCALVALLHSDGFLGISVVNGNAAAQLGVTVGDEVIVTGR